jgi:hypothetical protein
VENDREDMENKKDRENYREDMENKKDRENYREDMENCKKYKENTGKIGELR